MKPLDIVAQIIGFLALAFTAGSFQGKNRKRILIFQSLGSFLWMVQFILLGSYTGAIVNSISVIRNVFYYFKDKNKLFSSKWLPFLAGILYVICGIFTFDGILSVLPVIAALIASVAFYITEEKKIRILSLFVSPLWMVYDIFAPSIAGVLTESITLISIIIALFRFRKKQG